VHPPGLLRRSGKHAAAIALLLLLVGGAGAADLDFEALQSLITRDGVRSISGLLAALPADYRSNFALMFSSRSLQQASFRDPRVILYGSDARFLISFNGDASERGFDALETAQFDERNDRFEFRELLFPPAGSGEVQVSPVNPERCTRCHGEPARPIWDTSPLWPGAYGERYGSNLTAVERSGLQQFLRQQTQHPRYRALIGSERFAYRNTFVPDARSQYDGVRREPPNAELAGLLSALNMRMVARQVRDSKDYALYQYALLGAAEGNCGALEDFLPLSQQPGVRRELLEFRQRSEQANDRESSAKQGRALADRLRVHPRVDGTDHPTVLTDFRYVAESALGIATAQWTLALEKNSYDFATPATDDAGLAYLIRTDLAGADSNVAQLHQQREYSPDDRYCGYLRQRSRALLAQADDPFAHHAPSESQQQLTLSAASTPALLLQHCASCHSTGVAPPEPFGRPDALAPLLLGETHARGNLLDEILFRLTPEAGPQRMPPDTNLTPQQRLALSDYLVDLSHP
jgi:mono/diheme cytochrome c family protein